MLWKAALKPVVKHVVIPLVDKAWDVGKDAYCKAALEREARLTPAQRSERDRRNSEEEDRRRIAAEIQRQREKRDQEIAEREARERRVTYVGLAMIGAAVYSSWPHVMQWANQGGNIVLLVAGLLVLLIITCASWSWISYWPYDIVRWMDRRAEQKRGK